MPATKHETLRNVRDLLRAVSTHPRPAAYTWGGRRSVLAMTTYFGIYALRLLSPLQWIKFFVRRRSANRVTTNLRPDFPALFTELYFLTVTAAAVLAALAPLDLSDLPDVLSRALTGLVGIFLLESIAWVLYYLLLRPFLEGKYTIFDPAEYLVMFPLVIVEQLVLLQHLTGQPLGSLVAAFAGSPRDDVPLDMALSIAALVYLGVGISVLLTSHPGIATRQPQTMCVVGAGEVVSDRIIPALQAIGYTPRDLSIVDVQHPAAARLDAIRDVRVVRAPRDGVLGTVHGTGSPAIVASPTWAHLDQVVGLAQAGTVFAVEKPIVASRAQRRVLTDNASDIMRNGFALSYYTLEKGLSLTYFFNPLPIYRNYLCSSSDELLHGPALEMLREELGAVQSVSIRHLEGLERSPRGADRLWTEVPASLRPFIETTIHALSVVRNVTGPGQLAWDSCALGRYAPRADYVADEHGQQIAPTWIKASGRIDGIEVSLEVGKYIPDQHLRREARVQFSRGEAVCDFDRRRTSFVANGRPRGEIGIDVRQPGLSVDYAVMMSQFAAFAAKGWCQTRFDDFPAQLDSLEWWDDLCDVVDTRAVPVESYTDNLPAHPPTALR